MGKGIVVGFGFFALLIMCAWLVVQWAAFIAKMALEYGDLAGVALLFGPPAIFIIAFLAWDGRREGQ